MNDDELTEILDAVAGCGTVDVVLTFDEFLAKYGYDVTPQQESPASPDTRTAPSA